MQEDVFREAGFKDVHEYLAMLLQAFGSEERLLSAIGEERVVQALGEERVAQALGEERVVRVLGEEHLMRVLIQRLGIVRARQLLQELTEETPPTTEELKQH